VNPADKLKKEMARCKKLGLHVKIGGDRRLHDYAGMNFRAAKKLGFKMKPGEHILVAKALSTKDKADTLKHERVEVDLMKGNKPYFPAHEVALTKENPLYHGGRDLGETGTLKFGQQGRHNSGYDAGAIFVTPSKKYAKQYVQSPGRLYEAQIDLSKERIFDATNAAHMRLLQKKTNIQTVNSIRETMSHGAADWATLSQYTEELAEAGFTGAKFLERSGEDIEESETGGYKVSGPPVYSYGMFHEVPVKATENPYAYHGTRARFKKFDPKYIRELGFHFGTPEQAFARAKGRTIGRIAPPGVVKLCHLDIKRPYDMSSDLGDWGSMVMLREYFSSENEGPIPDRLFENGTIKTPADVVKYMQHLGYDGIVYDNQFEDTEAHGGFYNSSQSYIVFDPNHIHIKGEMKLGGQK
jgi:hypothetical protein